MQIGIRAHDCKKAPFDELIKNVNEQEFKCIQLALRFAIDEFPTDKCAMTPGMALYLKRILAKNDVDVAVLGCYLNLGTNDKEQLAQISEVYKAHIRFASLLGCGVVGTETYGFDGDASSDEALDTLIENLRPIVGYAEKMGVIIGLECVHYHTICNMKRMKRVLDAIDSPNLQVIYDPINTFSPETYENQAEMMTEAFEILGDDIAVIHAKDFVVEDGKIVPAQIGEGIFRFDVLMKFLKEKKPYIHVLLEETTPDTAIRSRKYVEEQYNKA
ncbi:MAG: sugar phosphate isomerase/epimerase [Firmicutes bacterium]|nr:sugar phosphate isomerase/epimerase [Bacillota bacterium]